MWARLTLCEAEQFAPMFPDDAGHDRVHAPHAEPAYGDADDAVPYRDLDPASLERRLPLYLRLQTLCTRYAALSRKLPSDQRLAVYLSVAKRTSSLRWLRTQETDTLELAADYLEAGLRRVGFGVDRAEE